MSEFLNRISDVLYRFWLRFILRKPDWQRLRMIRLAEQFFGTRRDSSQLVIDEEVLRRFRRIHPASVSEESDANGPIAWILLLPTTGARMEEFLDGSIGETELFLRTPEGIPYEALYLCSALVAPEARSHGVGKRMTVEAVRSIMRDHPVRTLFVWEFSERGGLLAEAMARAVNLRLRTRASTRAVPSG